MKRFVETSEGTVIVPKIATKIGKNEFRNCKELENIIIPDGVTSIGNYAFTYCKNLKSITIPNSVTHIGKHAFNDCDNLQSVTIPDSVTSIGDYVFFECNNSQKELTVKRSKKLISNALEWASNVSKQTTYDLIYAMGITSNELNTIGYDKDTFPDMHKAAKLI